MSGSDIKFRHDFRIHLRISLLELNVWVGKPRGNRTYEIQRLQYSQVAN